MGKTDLRSIAIFTEPLEGVLRSIALHPLRCVFFFRSAGGGRVLCGLMIATLHLYALSCNGIQ